MKRLNRYSDRQKFGETMVYRCPVCNKRLSKKEWKAASKRLGGLLEQHDLEAQQHIKEAEKQIRELEAQIKVAKKEGIKSERDRVKRLLQNKDRQIELLRQRINEIKKGTTPQTEGLEFEDKLTARLQKEFPGDKVEHVGMEHKGGGDILHQVMYEGRIAGTIVYECKRTQNLEGKHINQAYAAKIRRNADYALLVTTANPKRSWNGFGIIKEVLVVTPLAVIPLVVLLRQNLIEMLKSKIPIQKRNKIAQQLLKFIESNDYKNSIEDIARNAIELQQELKREIHDHFGSWRRRLEMYNKIRYNTSELTENIQRILHGKEVKKINAKLGIPELPIPKKDLS